MTNKILVMGATGKVGQEVVKCLSKQHVKVKAAIHQQKNAALLANLGAEIVSLDINQPDTLKNAFSGVKKLFLLIPGADSTKELTIAKQIIDYAQQVQIENIVHLSGMGAEKYPEFSHVHIEKYLDTKNIPHIHLRPNFFMQNFNTIYLSHIQQKGLINLYDADIPTSFIDTRDIGAVAAHCLLESYECKTVTLTGSIGLNHAQVAEILSKVSGRSIKYTAKSDEDSRMALRDCGWLDADIEKFLLLCRVVQKGGFAPVCTDVADILGRAPILFQQYAENHKDFWQ